MEYKGIRYKYVFDGLAGTIYKMDGEEKEIAFLQFPSDIEYLENQLENIKPNQQFSEEEIIDMILSGYDY